MKTYQSLTARSIRGLFGAGALVLAALAFTQPCAASPGLFMKLDGVDAWSELSGASSETKAATAFVPNVIPGVRISKRSDMTSPRLLQACGDGSPIKRITLAWRNAAGVVFRITLGNAMVRSFRTSLEPGVSPLPMEECAFTCDSVEWTWFGHNGQDLLIGGQTTFFDVPTQQATEKILPPFHASLSRVAGRNVMKIACPVERGRTYRISASTSLDGRWEKLEDFTATEDGQMERQLGETAGRLFLRVEALD